MHKRAMPKFRALGFEGFRAEDLGFRVNVRVPLINPPPPNLVLVPGVWRGGKKDGVPIMNSGGLGVWGGVREQGPP